MCEHGTLRAPRRSRGEEDDRRVRGCALDDVGHRLELAVEEARIVDEEARTGDPHSLVDLGSGEEDVEWHDDRSELQRPEPRGRERRAVREPQRDAIAGTDPERAQLRCGGPGAVLELVNAQRPVALMKRGSAGVVPARVDEHVCEIHPNSARSMTGTRRVA